uniref:Uncharacterized protein n=1 Tax=viral metagenome TaxID=1070528 RepID=A0A6C0DQR7_9ZZZZ
MYELRFYQNHIQTGSTLIEARDEALNLLVACTERYTHTDGFYVDESVSDVYTVVDLSSTGWVIKLAGPIDTVFKKELTHRFANLLNKWLTPKSQAPPSE